MLVVKNKIITISIKSPFMSFCSFSLLIDALFNMKVLKIDLRKYCVKVFYAIKIQLHKAEAQHQLRSFNLIFYLLGGNVSNGWSCLLMEN